jgi:hypothetical protein
VILLDTAPLVVLCDPRDALNPRALRDLNRVARRPLTACAPVLTEAVVLLPHAVQRRRLRRFLEEFSVVPYRIDDDRPLWSDVFAWLDLYAEHDPDWADGYLAPGI